LKAARPTEYRRLRDALQRMLTNDIVGLLAVLGLQGATFLQHRRTL
jgi:hypothetical protein